MNIALSVLSLVACALIFLRVESLLNSMCSKTKPTVRVAFWLLAVAVLMQVYSITQGHPVPVPGLLMQWALALWLTSERRLRGLLRMPTAYQGAERRGTTCDHKP